MTQPQNKSNRNLFVFIGVAIGICLICGVITMLTSEDIPTPQVTSHPATALPDLAATEAPPVSVDKYMQAYGGNPDVYIRILSLTDCAELQAEFETAYTNNQRETAGTDQFKWTLGYMTAIDEHMKALGCYE